LGVTNKLSAAVGTETLSGTSSRDGFTDAPVSSPPITSSVTTVGSSVMEVVGKRNMLF